MIDEKDRFNVEDWYHWKGIMGGESDFRVLNRKQNELPIMYFVWMFSM